MMDFGRHGCVFWIGTKRRAQHIPPFFVIIVDGEMWILTNSFFQCCGDMDLKHCV